MPARSSAFAHAAGARLEGDSAIIHSHGYSLKTVAIGASSEIERSHPGGIRCRTSRSAVPGKPACRHVSIRLFPSVTRSSTAFTASPAKLHSTARHQYLRPSLGPGARWIQGELHSPPAWVSSSQYHLHHTRFEQGSGRVGVVTPSMLRYHRPVAERQVPCVRYSAVRARRHDRSTEAPRLLWAFMPNGCVVAAIDDMGHRLQAHAMECPPSRRRLRIDSRTDVILVCTRPSTRTRPSKALWNSNPSFLDAADANRGRAGTASRAASWTPACADRGRCRPEAAAMSRPSADLRRRITAPAHVRTRRCEGLE
jgi:hypothetical protein